MRASPFTEGQIIGILELVEAGQKVGAGGMSPSWDRRGDVRSPEGAVRIVGRWEEYTTTRVNMVAAN